MTKSGYQGDMLLAMIGHCKNCGAEARVYFARCNERLQDLMLNESKFKEKHKGLCEVCFIGKGHTGTVNWEAKLPYFQADKDLAILDTMTGLTDIDENIKEIKDSDSWWENQDGKVADYKKYIKKKLM